MEKSSTMLSLIINGKKHLIRDCSHCAKRTPGFVKETSKDGHPCAIANSMNLQKVLHHSRQKPPKTFKNTTVQIKVPIPQTHAPLKTKFQSDSNVDNGSENSAVESKVASKRKSIDEKYSENQSRSKDLVWGFSLAPNRNKHRRHEYLEKLEVTDSIKRYPQQAQSDVEHEKGVNPVVQISQDMPSTHKSSIKKDNDHIAIASRKEVKGALRLYQAVVRKLLQDQESTGKNVHINHRSKRADLIAAKMLKEKDRWVNTGKKILGAVPGVEVGDEFHCRAELALIGLHHPFQSGIDFVPLTKTRKSVATSIVTAWCYADDMESSGSLVYLGQGGNPIGPHKKVENQKLEGPNLALKNSIDEGTPVRVIRGIKGTRGKDSPSTRGKLVSTYIYDGLYLVERYWQEKGSYGTDVFKFQLRRLPEQPELPINELKKSAETRLCHCLYGYDISQGKETMPIGAVNAVDEEKPPLFEYITSMIYPSWCKVPPPNGCNCSDDCADPTKCACAVKNGGQIPFNHSGAIVEAKPLVYECGPACGCPPSCYNRVSQHGRKFQLEIFKTESRGWGVRSLNSISSGSFICEYTGELLQDEEAEQRTSNDEYLFDIGHNYNNQDLWEGLSKFIPPDLKSLSSDTEEVEPLTIDGAQRGNIGRFINHSCSPNIYAQNVLYDHEDKRIPHIMFFAAENIPPLQELTYHYNYELNQVCDSHGNIKKKNCYCGSPECSGRMY